MNHDGSMQMYSFLTNTLLLDGVPVTGWSEGDDVIKVARSVDSASDKVGSGGSMMVSVSGNRSGTFTIKLQKTSPSNAYLMAKVYAMESLILVPVAVKIQDTFRQDMAAGAQCYIKRMSDQVWGENAGDQEWVIRVANLIQIFGPGVFLL